MTPRSSPEKTRSQRRSRLRSLCLPLLLAAASVGCGDDDFGTERAASDGSTSSDQAVPDLAAAVDLTTRAADSAAPDAAAPDAAAPDAAAVDQARLDATGLDGPTVDGASGDAATGG